MKRSIVTRGITALALGLVVPFSTIATSFAATPSDIYTTVDKATTYLTSLQQTDGSMSGYGGSSDWSAIALAATGITNTQLDTYIANETAPTTVTGIERKILALAATHQATSGYDALLAKSYQNNQIGDPTLLNDDWFGVMAIIAAKDTADYSIASASVGYIIDHQDTTGGFGYCTDTASCGVDSNDTAAAVVALASAQKVGIVNSKLSSAISNAVEYLKKTKQSDGGFGYDTNSWTTSSDSASTSWVLMALSTVADDSLNDTANEARNWLISAQDSASGSYGYEWNGYNADTPTTANAVLALVGTNWLLNPAPISRPVPVDPSPSPTPTPTPTPTPPTVSTAPVATTPVTTVATAAPAQTDDTAYTDTTVPSTDTSAATDGSNGVVQGASTTTPSDTAIQNTATTPSAQKSTAKQPQKSTVAHIVGMSLISLASIGLIAYGLIFRRRHAQ